MGTFLLVAGDFVPTGGMDMANLALARYLATRGDTVHLVSHRIADDLANMPTVRLHRVPKPAGSYLLGELLLNRVGMAWAGRIARAGGRVITNGGNCQWGDVNWVHYVHAAYREPIPHNLFRRLKSAVRYHRSARTERRALRSARVVIANSERTARDVVQRLGVRPEVVHVVYCGVDPERFRPRSCDERRSACSSLGWSADVPSLAFVGAVRDHRKGFATVAAAWRSLEEDTRWDAQLVIVGDATGAEAILQTAGFRTGARRIKFLGFRDDVDRILAACDGLVSPVRYEPYGLGVQEALCSGLPAVVSAAAGVAERYPPALHRLLIQNPENVEEVRTALRGWRHDLDDLKADTLQIAASLREETWDVMAARIAAVIDAR